uniref:Uncharacterized protein n=1 Tax=Panagrolaimus sp. ES5 TaxID=591445 RepID=A0AC34GEB7_9BILA
YKKKQKTKPTKLRGPGINFLWCAPKQYDYSSYPTDAKAYTGELKELKVIEEAPSANLFDCVSFASRDDVNQNLFLNGHVVSQPTLFEHQQPIIIEQESVAIPYGYPAPTEIYEGEIDDLQPQKDYDHINIYERIEQVPKGISYVPPARKPSFLDKIRRASFRESHETVSFERETIKEEVQHVQKSENIQRTEPLEIPTIIEREQSEEIVVLDKMEDASKIELPVTEEIYIVEESKPIRPIETLNEQTMEMDIDLIKSGDISYHNETTIVPNVFITESVESDTIPATIQELKNYPILSEPYSGEISALNKQDEATSSHLFDEINFLIVDKNVEKPIASKVTKTSKTNKFLWCGGGQKQRSESPEALKTSRAESFRSRVRTFS